ncbi:MAG: TM1802 family CRISPR-associated protein [Clostridia bacterium]
MFGLNDNEKFLYPGEVTAFTKYFREKLAPSALDDACKDKKTEYMSYCALCQKTGQGLETLDKVFKFATFDKPGFLPGAIRGAEIEEKVFPVCKTCYEVLSAGKEEMGNRFVNLSIIPNVSLYVVPEIISDRQEFFRKAADHTKDFLKNGVRYETQLFKYLLRQNEGLVFHFLFAETNQAQLIIHSLVEDVPPTHLRKLQELWTETCQAFSYDNDVSDKKCSLDTAISQIVAVLMSLAGKGEQDKRVMKDKVISVISGLLNGETIGIKDIKALMISRLAGLMTDPDWLRPLEKEEMSGQQKIKGMAEVIDFLYRANWR